MTKTWKKVTTFLLGLVMLGGAVGGGAFANSVGGGVELNAAEQTVTIAAADFGLGNGASVSNANVKGIIFDGAKGTHRDSFPSYWTSDSTVRMYKGNTFSITSTIGKMTSITMTFERGGSYISISSENATYSNPTITSNDAGGMESVSLSTSGTLRIESFVIVVTSEDITLDDLYVMGEEAFTTFDVLTTEDFLLDGTKSDGTEVTFEDVTAHIGHDTELRDVEWGVTKPLVTDTLIRFTSLLPNTSGEYDTCDVNITVTEPKVASIAISGDMTKKSYIPGDYWDPSGLVVTGTFDVGGTTDLTNEVEWTYYPGVPTLDIDYVIVTASYNGVNNSVTINDIVVENLVADVITSDDYSASGTSYGSLDITKSSGAHYIGQVAKHNGAIQINSNRTNRAISTDTSGGRLHSVTIDFAPDNENTVEILGNTTAYTESSSAGTPLGTLGSNGTIIVEGDYEFVRIQSTDGVVYMDSIQIVWEPTSSTVTLDSVEVVGTMNKTTYYTNEEWKADGLSVDLHYSDGDLTLRLAIP